ncbi:MAG TPA: hypothetical protein VH684_16825 [Xanthobacteraceae bacterium]
MNIVRQALCSRQGQVVRPKLDSWLYNGVVTEAQVRPESTAAMDLRRANSMNWQPPLLRWVTS